MLIYFPMLSFIKNQFGIDSTCFATFKRDTMISYGMHDHDVKFELVYQSLQLYN
jgi:hypothetical protein